MFDFRNHNYDGVMKNVGHFYSEIWEKNIGSSKDYKKVEKTALAKDDPPWMVRQRYTTYHEPLQTVSEVQRTMTPQG